MALLLLRFIFVVAAAAIGASIVYEFQTTNPMIAWGGFLGVITIALGIILADILIRRKSLEMISAIYFGITVGLFLTYVLSIAMGPILPEDIEDRKALQLPLSIVLIYICTSVLLQTRNDFRFVIPYVEFSREVKGLKPCLLDTSVIIDGRIADVVDCKVIDNPLIMPQFVLSELQAIADSSDRIRRGRGRRGLDILQRLQSNENVDLRVYDRDLPELHDQPVDLKLVLLAKHLEGKIVTNDFNLNKIAQLHGVIVVNLNSLANALRPSYLPGEELCVKIIKPGEEASQGVGYLEDGTMVVVEGAREYLHKRVMTVVTSTLQTNAGRMIFAKFSKAD